MRGGVRHIAVQAHYLAAVADNGSWNAAARHCKVAPQTVAAGVRYLEKAVGVVLVNADSSGVTLTDDGLEVLSECRRMVAANRSILDYAKEA